MTKQEMRTLDVRLVHLTFRISLIIKGLLAAGETLAGFLMVYFTPPRVQALINQFLATEIGQEYLHFWHEYLINFGHGYTVGTQLFALFYLVSHGVVKFVVVVFLWQERLWAYPLSILALLGFIAYQLYYYQFNHSIMLIVLTVLDVVLIALTLLEWYNLVKGRQPMHVRKRQLRRRKRWARRRRALVMAYDKRIGKLKRSWRIRLNQWESDLKRQERRQLKRLPLPEDEEKGGRQDPPC